MYTLAAFALKLILVISPAKAFIFVEQFVSCVNMVPAIEIFRGTGGQGLLRFPSQQLVPEGRRNGPINHNLLNSHNPLAVLALPVPPPPDSNANFTRNHES